MISYETSSFLRRGSSWLIGYVIGGFFVRDVTEKSVSQERFTSPFSTKAVQLRVAQAKNVSRNFLIFEVRVDTRNEMCSSLVDGAQEAYLERQIRFLDEKMAGCLDFIFVDAQSDPGLREDFFFCSYRRHREEGKSIGEGESIGENESF